MCLFCSPKTAKKLGKGPRAETCLEHPFVTAPFAAAQFLLLESETHGGYGYRGVLRKQLIGCKKLRTRRLCRSRGLICNHGSQLQKRKPGYPRNRRKTSKTYRHIRKRDNQEELFCATFLHFLTCSFCHHDDFVKDIPCFWRQKIGKSRLKSAKAWPKFDSKSTKHLS